MPSSLTDILATADELLSPELFADYGPNGLQFPGRESVSLIASGVSAGVELFERARDEGADLVLVHHGIFWGSGPVRPVDRALKGRLKVLFETDMSLLAYHLPLDGHPEIGNNALLAKAIGAAEHLPFAQHRGQAIGRLARFPDPGVDAQDLFARIGSAVGREPLVFADGPELVRSIAIVSGAGSDYLAEAVAAGADAFLTGEPAERVMGEAREAAVHFIAAGHYATETFGVRALGELLAGRLDVGQVFIDLPNPI